MSISKAYQINGVIDTNKTLLENLEILASSCNTFFTFDIHNGKWSVIINQPGTSVKNYNDSNIIGSISISTTGLTEYYNQVQVDFPHKDLLDQTDTVISTIPEANWFPNEQPKVLKLAFDTVNDPIQALMLGSVQLKQSRVDQIIKFDTDYTSIGLQAGDLITVTNSIYNFTNKIFRVINVQESDDQDGGLNISITALEYNPNVYTTDTLTRQLRTPKTGIIQKNANTDIAKNDISIGGIALTLGAVALLGAVEKLLLGDTGIGGIFDKIFELFKEKTGIDLIGSVGGGALKSNLIVKDEGNQLTKSAKSINFVGNGVTATHTDDDITVTINTTSTGTGGGNSNSITKPSDTSSVSTGGEVCPLSFLQPGFYYVPETPKPSPWQNSCTVGKHWTVIPHATSGIDYEYVNLKLESVIQYGSGPYYAKYILKKPELYYYPANFPKVGNYYQIKGLLSTNGEEYVKCSAIIPNESVTVEYPYNPGVIKVTDEDNTVSSATLTGINKITTFSNNQVYYDNGYGTNLKTFTLSNPSDLEYKGTYTLEMSCNIGYIDISASKDIIDNSNSFTAYNLNAGDGGSDYLTVRITPKRPLKITSSATDVNSFIGNGGERCRWYYVKDADSEELKPISIPPSEQSVSIIYKITYNSETRTFTDTMTYVPYEQWITENNE